MAPADSLGISADGIALFLGIHSDNMPNSLGPNSLGKVPKGTSRTKHRPTIVRRPKSGASQQS